MSPPSADLPKGAHVYIDETKAREYLMVATWIAAKDVDQARRTMRGLQPVGQRRLHFKKLKEIHRRSAIAAIRQIPLRAVVARSNEGRDRLAREEALRRITSIATASQAVRLVIELDDSYRTTDLRFIREVGGGVDVVHLRSHEEPLLWASDAIAWCLQRGGEWAESIRPLLLAGW